MDDPSLLGRLKRLFLPDTVGSGAEKRSGAYVVASSQKVPVVRYVDALLGHLIERRDDIVLKGTLALPAVGEAAGESLSYGAAVNRLKVLAGLYPVAYPQPMEGHLRYAYRGCRYEIAAFFDDRGSGATCRLSVVGIDDEKAGPSRVAVDV